MRSRARRVALIASAGLVAGLALTGCDHDGDRIIEQHYRECIAHGGSYKQGDGLDDFSCDLPKERAR